MGAENKDLLAVSNDTVPTVAKERTAFENVLAMYPEDIEFMGILSLALLAMCGWANLETFLFICSLMFLWSIASITVIIFSSIKKWRS
jgi:hypothetical protein